MSVVKELFQGKSVIIWCVIVFLFAFGLRGYWISQKVNIHADEGLTHFISSYTGYNWADVYSEDKIYTGKEIKEITFKNKIDLKNSMKDISSLHKDNDGDSAHSNLYYSFYRLWMTGGSESLGLRELINRGCGLNLVFFSLSFFFMFKLLKGLFGQNKLVPFGLACAFLNTGSISNTLLIRPYQLQETILIFMTWIFVIYYKKICNKENIISLKNFIILSFALGITMLSAYFSLIYLGLLGLILLCMTVRTSQYKNIGFLFLTLLGGLLVTLAAYSGYFTGFTSDRASYALSNPENAMIIHNLVSTILNFIVTYINFLFYVPLILLIGIAGIKKLKNDINFASKLPLVLVFTTLLWSLAVMYLAPYKILRYIMPIFPIVSLIFPYVFSKLKVHTAKIFMPLCILVLVVNAVFATSSESYETGVKGNIMKSLPMGANIENLFLNLSKDCKFKDKPQLPVIFYNDDNNWRFSNMVLNMADGQKYEFYMDENKPLPDYNHLFVLYGVNVSNKMHNKSFQGYKVLDLYKCGYFAGYELIKE